MTTERVLSSPQQDNLVSETIRNFKQKIAHILYHPSYSGLRKRNEQVIDIGKIFLTKMFMATIVKVHIAYSLHTIP